MRRSDLQAQLQEAIQLAQAGQRTEARRLFEEIVQADPTHALAWLWLATVSTDREERIHFLERTLSLDPGNTRAQEAYAQLTGSNFVPPEVPASGTADRVQRIPPSAVNLFVVIGFVVVAVVLVLLFSGVFTSEDETPTPIPTRASFTPSRTAGPSPTWTWTPLPSDTPGPSPTSIWDAPPATWTPLPTATETLTLVPSLTPTRRPTQPPPTVRPSATELPSRTPVPSDTPTATATAPAEATATTEPVQ